MTYPRPVWADALQGLMTMATRQTTTPWSFLETLSTMPGGAQVDDRDFADFLIGTVDDDPALTAVRLAFGQWDAAKADEIDGFDTKASPNTEERRQDIYRMTQMGPWSSKALDERVKAFRTAAVVISKTFEPWYKKDGDSPHSTVYWDDYAAYLTEGKNWDAEALHSLDRATTNVVERLSDPTRAEIKQTKGLVVGYVQSGKTANFTGVIAKAVDAGYRLIIVLTGTIEILRAQTQRRMDMELMGEENILGGQDPTDPQVLKELDYQEDLDWIAKKFVTHGTRLEQNGVPRIDRVTTHRRDYTRLPQGLTKLKFFKYERSKPFNDPDNLFRSDAYVAVIKKNVAPLSKLIKDLKPIRGDLAQLPVLIIDDESDQATPDTTNPKKWRDAASERKRTRINGLITQILEICPRAQYVGYTATPFANVFIDPNDERDLFPSDFVISLPRTPGYMGVQEFHDVGRRWDDEEKTFGNSNELAHVRSLTCDPEEDPAGRTTELSEAIEAWVLAGAIKKYREAQNAALYRYRHHTMLVHESTARDEHSATADEVRAIWRKGQYTSMQGLERLSRLYEKDYLSVMQARAGTYPVPATFDELRPYIAQAVAHMTRDRDPVLVVNSDKEIQEQQQNLDFDAQDVWRILVGGTKLSRGFTVEGLTVSYYRRKTGQADTLMQAGRWFGYRRGYEDLVRLYIRRDDKVDLYSAFESLLMDEEAFRAEIAQYEGLDEDGRPLIEPRQIPPLVSQHLPWLKPTARNKMWNAVIETKATSGGLQDRYGLPPRGDTRNLANLTDVGVPLLRHVATAPVQAAPYKLTNGNTGTTDMRIGIMSAEEFIDRIGALEWDDDFRATVIEPSLRFIRKATEDGRITEWAVGWPVPKKCGYMDLRDLSNLPVIQRSRRSDRAGFIGSDSKHRAALQPLAAGMAALGLEASSTRGVALIYLADDRRHDDSRKTWAERGSVLKPVDVVPLLSIATPAAATPHRRDLIRWTVRVQEHADDVVVDVKE